MRTLKAALLLLLTACLCGCASGPQPRPAITIAVWDLENVSPTTSPIPELGALLAAEVVATLQPLDGITVIERQRLLLALEELALGSSTLADEGSRLELGRILGAHQMIFGAYQVVGPAMRLDLRRVDVASGRVLGATSQTSPAADAAGWLAAARTAAAGLFP